MKIPWRAIFFAINFSLSLLLVLLCLWNVWAGSAGHPADAPESLVVLIPAAAFGWGEWRLYVSKFYSWERPLGALCGVIGLFILVAFTVGIIASTASGNSPGLLLWLVLGGVYLTVAGYAFLCCWMRSRLSKISRPEGFRVLPVGDFGIGSTGDQARRDISAMEGRPVDGDHSSF